MNDKQQTRYEQVLQELDIPFDKPRRRRFSDFIPYVDWPFWLYVLASAMFYAGLTSLFLFFLIKVG
jgi:hypothetical protein